jgi:hypothetical protein
MTEPRCDSLDPIIRNKFDLPPATPASVPWEALTAPPSADLSEDPCQPSYASGGASVAVYWSYAHGALVLVEEPETVSVPTFMSEPGELRRAGRYSASIWMRGDEI